MAMSVGCNEGGCKARSAEGTARLSAGRLGGREKPGPGSLGDLALTRDQGVVCRYTVQKNFVWFCCTLNRASLSDALGIQDAGGAGCG